MWFNQFSGLLCFMKQWAFGYAASLQGEDTRTNHLLSGGKVEVKNSDFDQLKWFLFALLLRLPWSPKRWRLAVSFFPHLTLTVVDFSGMCSRNVPFFGTLQPLSFCTLNFTCISVELKVRQGATEITRNRERRGIEFHQLSLQRLKMTHCAACKDLQVNLVIWLWWSH